MRLIAALKRRTTQKQNKMQEPGWTVPWNPTLAQKTRKDGAPIGRNDRSQKTGFFSTLWSRIQDKAVNAAVNRSPHHANTGRAGDPGAAPPKIKTIRRGG